MAACNLCGKELAQDSDTMQLYKTHILQRSIAKSRLGSETTSEYAKFTLVQVQICRKHRTTLWTQRFMSSLIVFLLLYIPVATLFFFLTNSSYDWSQNVGVFFLVGAAITIIPVVFLARRISYDGFIASALNLLPSNRENAVEYFHEARYNRLIARLKKLNQ